MLLGELVNWTGLTLNALVVNDVDDGVLAAASAAELLAALEVLAAVSGRTERTVGDVVAVVEVLAVEDLAEVDEQIHAVRRDVYATGQVQILETAQIVLGCDAP